MRRQSLLLIAPRQLEWVIEDLPPLQPNELLIQTTTAAISIGSELPIYCGTARSTEPIRYPRMIGYESAAVVLNYQEHAKWFFNFVQEHPADLEQLFDYQTTSIRLTTTFEQLATGTIAPIKVLVKYNEDITKRHEQ